jgi:DHA1 family multidrug resistance protein-like MFS transporter
MMDIIRDSSLGQLIRFITKNKALLYEEEKATFSCPKCYDNSEASSQEKIPTHVTTTASSSAPSAILSTEDGKEDVPASEEGEAKETLAPSKTADRDIESGYEHLTMWKVPTQAEIQRTYTEQGRAERAVSRPIEAVKTADGTILVDWYTTGMLLVVP